MAQNISDAEIKQLGRAYIEGIDRSNDRQIQDMARAYADKVQRDFRKLKEKIDVIFTERDPYQHFGEMERDVLVNGRMYVYTQFSDVPLWSPEVNIMARAVHDWEHIKHRAQFTQRDEIRAFQATMDEIPQFEPLIMSEVALQASSTAILGGFMNQQKIVIPSDEMKKLARRRLNPGGFTARDKSIVWDVAGALRYMSATDAMRALASNGVPMNEALVAVLAADRIL
jgi:hypothetical protein